MIQGVDLFLFHEMLTDVVAVVGVYMQAMISIYGTAR